MKYLLLILGLFSQFAHATNITLTVSDTTGLYWDRGNAQYGQTNLQLYPAYLPNEPTQSFLFTQVGSNWTICSGPVCLYDSGSGLMRMGNKSDQFTSTVQSNGLYVIRDVETGKYVGQVNPSVGGFVPMNGSAYGWKLTPLSFPTSTITIMPFGDSITEGFPTPQTLSQGGYRCSLAASLGSGYSFVGDAVPYPGESNNVDCPNVHWEGHAGYRIDQLSQYLGDVKALKPRLILLMGGTNDVAQGQTGYVGSRLTNLINELLASDPGVHIFLSTIPPASASISWSVQIPNANAQIRSVGESFGKEVTLVDFYSVDGGANWADGVHPNVYGYGLLEGVWLKSIQEWE